MNTSLAFFQKRIPYIPELTKLCGSVAASILMQQLDFWFSHRPDGFYKFLSACDHAQYVEGDSWTEELAFSEHEFRTAFDRIGVRYRSKSALQKAQQKNADPFAGKLYYSVHDVRQGVTFYYRNHVRVDQLINELICSEKAQKTTQPIEKYRNQNSELQKCGIRSSGNQNIELQKCGSRSSRNADSAFPYIGTEITTEKDRQIEKSLDKKITNSPEEVISHLVEWGIPKSYFARTADRNLVECLLAEGMDEAVLREALVRAEPRKQQGNVSIHYLATIIRDLMTRLLTKATETAPGIFMFGGIEKVLCHE